MFIERNQTGSCARELLNSAESAPALLGSSRSFDKTAHHLGAQLREVDGAIPRYRIINLKNGKTKPALASDGLFRLPGAHYDPKAQAPLWRAFIEQVTAGDKDLADFLQLAVGYTLFGHTNEQVMFILIGSGGNGKGVFCNTLYLMFGEYAVVVQSGLLKPGAISANNPSPALMSLDGKRLWTCSEVPKGMVLDEALTKQITGGDFLSTRALYGDQVEFKPIGKLWLSVNNMPRVRHDDEGMWRRIIPIPFNAVFSGKDRDNNLEQKLKEELSGILNWALEGAQKYAAQGRLGRPKATTAMLSQLRREVDSVGQWVQARCKDSAGEKLQAKIAYDDYCEYAKRERAIPIPQKEFKDTLTSRGYAHRSGNKFNYYLGLVLLQDSL